MSTHGLSLQILNSVKNSSKRKETVDRKKIRKKDCQKRNTGGMKRLSAHIFDASFVPHPGYRVWK